MNELHTNESASLTILSTVLLQRPLWVFWPVARDVGDYVACHDGGTWRRKMEIIDEYNGGAVSPHTPILLGTGSVKLEIAWQRSKLTQK